MKNVLVILSTSATPDEALDFAVGKAKEAGAKIIALYIVELDLKKEIFDRFSDVGFIGDKPSTELSEAVMKEYRQRGYEEMGRVQVKAMEGAVDFEPRTEQGDYLATALDIIGANEVDLVVAVRRKQSLIGRYFSKSHADELKDAASCEVVIFEAE